MYNIIKKINIVIILIILLSTTTGFYFTPKNNLVEYNGKIEHLTFETLIAFPNKILNNNNPNSYNYDETKITPNEFKNILKELHKNNYILINLEELYFIENNTIYLKTLMLPENKKPLILSFNNVSYKSSFQSIGEIDKIIIDRNNKLATYSTKQSIQDRISHDNEFIPILENYIENNPDFSFNNAKGIIFVTGENGLLGYEINPKNSNSKHDRKKVLEIIIKLKNNGWKFGSNNYSFINEENLNDMEFMKNISLWNSQVKNLIGDTPYYAFPYGNLISENSTKFNTLIDNNFKIFFYNDFDTNLELNNNTIFMSRKKVNGKTLRNNQENFDKIFNCKKVYDHSNRFIKFTENIV